MEGGVNSDLAPILLPKNVASWTINATLRGGFARPRPPLFRRTLIFSSAEIQNYFQTGFFQGMGYYRPDFGSAQWVMQISGRLYSLTESSDGWNVADITIPNDANDATTSQVWMNQAEKWLIITDGSSKFPIFWDGVTARRSLGPSVLIVTASATDPLTPPAIGATIVLTIPTFYDGPLNVPVLFNGEYYQVISVEQSPPAPTPAPVYNAIVTYIQGPGGPYPVGSVIATQPSYVGFTNTSANLLVTATFSRVIMSFADPHGITNAGDVLFGTGEGLVFPVYYRANPGDPLTLFPISAAWVVTGIPTPNTLRVETLDITTGNAIGTMSVVFGTLIRKASTAEPSVTVATVAIQFSSAGVGVPQTIQTTQPYLGTDNQSVWLGNTQFLISQAPPPVPPVIPPPQWYLVLSNISDASGSITNLNVLSVPELPAGRMGAYGLGHQTMSLTDGISFIYGDTVGGPSGTPANDYRDSVLKTTENTFLESRGSFRIPTSGDLITSMTFTAILDRAYGQGPLSIGTPSSIFTCDVPTNQASWIALENPILTQALIAKGPLAQNSTVLVNSDTLFRTTEGLSSLIFGRRDFETWGNTPISTEVNRTILQDNRNYLSYGSSIVFDNRFLTTAAPMTSGRGIVQVGTLALNLDPVSSLRGKAPSIWESLWTGINALQYGVGTFGSIERAFMMTFNQVENKLEFFEQARSDSGLYFDNGTDRIQWVVETPCIFKPDEREPSMPIVRLRNGKMQMANIVGTVRIRVLWRPDFYPCWSLWFQRDICATVDPANPDSQAGYATEIGFGEPPVLYCSAANDRPLRDGRFHQIRLEVTGQCVVMGLEFAAVPEPVVTFPAPVCNIAET